MLKQITGMDDRTNRNIIKDLRIEGIPIISVSSEPSAEELADLQADAEEEERKETAVERK